MEVSYNSQRQLNQLYNKFNKCMLEKEIRLNSKSSDAMFFKTLFHKLNFAENYINSNKIRNQIKKYSKNITSIKEMKFPSIYNSSFFPEVVKKYVELNTIKSFIYNTKLDDRHINFHFYTSNNEIPESMFDVYVNYMLMWIYILNTYNSNTCSKHLNVFIFLTDLKKNIPHSNIDILDKEHVNTAYTIACSENSEIVIYRKEEWFKVFLHETMHNFGFDFSTMKLYDLNNQIYNLFPIQSNFNLFESYCETWARIINSAFCSYSIQNNKNNIESFITHCNAFLQIERLFSLYQTNKILNFLGLKYENLYKKDEISITARNNLYREKSSVFAYFIITSIFMNDYTKFIKWCGLNNIQYLKFNQNPRTLQSFYTLIKTNYKDKIFIKSLNCIETQTKRENTKKSSLDRNLRMSILELN